MEEMSGEESNESAGSGSGIGPSGPPWEDPQAGELIQRTWDTIVLGVSRPRELFENMRTTGGMLQPLLFYAAVVGSAAVASWFLQLPIQLIGGTSVAELMIWLVFMLVLLPFLLPIGLFISAGLTHLGLMIFGGAGRPFEATFRANAHAYPFEATFRVNAYAYGTVGWIGAVPICGGFLYMIWGIVLQIMGIARVHEISTGKAVAAVLVPIFTIILFFTCVVVVFVAAVSEGFS